MAETVAGMRMDRFLKPVTAVAAASSLAACATPPQTPLPPPQGADVSSGQDCSVFAAIAREHYRFAENPPPPLWAEVDEENGGRYFVQCDWPRLGVPMTGETYDPQDPRPGRLQWVKFERPTYLGQRARVATAIMHGPLAGMGYECVVISGVVGWSVESCRSTWVS